MDKRLKWTLLTLLGFSTACSSVRQAPKQTEEEMTPVEKDHGFVAMYGVRVASPEELEQLPPVEQPTETSPQTATQE